MVSQAVSVGAVKDDKSTRAETIHAINDAVTDYGSEYKTPESLDSVLVSLGYRREREMQTRKGRWEVFARYDYPLFSLGNEQDRFASVIAYYTDAEGKIGYVFTSNPEADTPSLDEVVSNAQHLSSGLIERRLSARTVTKISTAIGGIAGGIYGSIVAPATIQNFDAVVTWARWGFGLLALTAGAGIGTFLGTLGNPFLVSDYRLENLHLFNPFSSYTPTYLREAVVSGKAFSKMSHPESFFYGWQAIGAIHKISEVNTLP